MAEDPRVDPLRSTVTNAIWIATSLTMHASYRPEKMKIPMGEITDAVIRFSEVEKEPKLYTAPPSKFKKAVSLVAMFIADNDKAPTMEEMHALVDKALESNG